jgi:prophage antirepressor-like protein
MKTLNSISTFVFEEKTELNIILLDGEPWFIAVEICEILELTNPTVSLKGLDNDEKLTLEILRAGQKRKVNLINESGLYTLIMRSTKPQAKVFRKWVTSEVLPQIRKTGSYQTDNQRVNTWQEMLAELDERYILAQEMDEFAFPLIKYIQSLDQRIYQLEQKQPTEASDYVYVLHNRQTNEYKIGKSGDIPTRQKSLHSVEPNIYVYLKLAMQSARHASLWERTLQIEFESKRLHGEWFKLNEQDLAVLRLLAKMVVLSAENN